MNASPHGAIVVPTVAVITRISVRPRESEGTTAPRAAADQSGPASTPASTYALSVAARMSRMCSMRLKRDPITSHETPTAATGTLIRARNPREVEGRGDTSELRGGRAHVRDDQDRRHRERRAHAEALADQSCQTLSRDGAEPHRDGVVEDQHGRRHDQHPEQRVAVVGAEDRVRGDARGIVVGEAGEHARAEHREERGDADPAHLGPAASDDAAGGAYARDRQPRRGGATCAQRARLQCTGRRESSVVTVASSSSSSRSRGASSSSAPAASLGQMQAVDRKQLRLEPCRKARETEAPEEGCEPDLDRRDLERRLRAPQHHVADADDAPPFEVDDLAIEESLAQPGCGRAAVGCGRDKATVLHAVNVASRLWLRTATTRQARSALHDPEVHQAIRLAVDDHGAAEAARWRGAERSRSPQRIADRRSLVRAPCPGRMPGPRIRG